MRKSITQFVFAPWRRPRAFNQTEQPRQRRSVSEHRHHFVEALEHRTLLAGDLIAGVGFHIYPLTAGQPFPGVSPIPSGMAVTVGATVAADALANSLEDIKNNIPEGNVVVQWYGGPILVTLPVVPVLTPTDPSGFKGYPLIEDKVATLDPANAGIPITKGPYKGDYLIYAYFTGGGGFAPANPFPADAYEIAQGGGDGGGLRISFSDAPVVSDDDHMQFLQQPQSAATDDLLDPPVTIQMFDKKGNLAVGSSAILTVSLDGGDPSAVLSGTKSQSVVNGVATFPDLRINKPGKYFLKVVADSAGVKTIFSQKFTIGSTKLAYGKPPAAGSAGDPLKPITVEIRDAAGKIITSDNETVVTLEPIGFTGDAPITGNVAAVVNGVATFDNLVVKRPGSYVLQASDGESVVANSKKFKVSGGKLQVTVQPTFADVNSPIDLKVAVKTAQGKIDTDSTSFARLTLNPVDPSSTAVLGGAFVVPFVGGIATFGGDGGAFIDQPGKYTFTVTEVQESLGSFIDADTSTPIDTKQLQVGGYALKFAKSPGPADVNGKLSFSVASVDPKGKVNQKLNSHRVLLTLTAVEGGANAVLSDFNNAGFVAGVQVFGGEQAPSINVPGTYTLTATEVDDAGAPVDSTAAATSKPFKVTGVHLKFSQKIQDVDTHAPIEFAVAVLDAKNKVARNYTGFVSIGVQHSGTGDFNVTGPGTVAVVGGVATFTGDNALAIDKAGTYALTAQTSDENGSDAGDDVESVTSEDFKVTGFHLKFSQKIRDVDTKAPIEFEVAVLDSKNKVDTNFTGFVSIAVQTSGSLEFNVNGPIAVPVVNGIATFSGSNALSIDKAGTYALTAQTSDADGADAGDDVEPVTSEDFKVTGVHLKFSRKIKDVDTNEPIEFAVTVLNSKNKVAKDYSGFVSVGVQSAGTPDFNLTGPGTVAVVNGVATFTGGNALAIDKAGTYALQARTSDANGFDAGDDVEEITSEDFKVNGVHLKFSQKIKNVETNSLIEFAVVVLDSKNKVAKNYTGFVSIGVQSSETADFTVTGPGTVPVVNGIASFTGDNALAIDIAGTYALLARTSDINGSDTGDDVEEITSESFAVTVP